MEFRDEDRRDGRETMAGKNESLIVIIGWLEGRNC